MLVLFLFVGLSVSFQETTSSRFGSAFTGLSAQGVAWKETGSKEEGPTFFGLSAQGVTNDGEHMYWSGRNRLRKTTISSSMDWKSVAEKNNPLPASLQTQGFWHVGDCDYHNGFVVAAVERHDYKNPGFVYFDTNLTYSHVVITNQSHAPWVAQDEMGNLYSSEFNNVTSLYQYAPNGKLQRKLALRNLPSALMALQGGVIRNGTLYLSSSAPGQPITSFDVKTGFFKQAFNTSTHKENEGLTIDPSGYLYQVTNTQLFPFLKKIFQFHQQ